MAATLEQRLSTAVETLVKVTPAATMLTLLGERTDVDSLIGFVSQNSVAIASAALVEDPLRAAKSRAAAKMADLMAAEGGPWGVEQVAKHLQITRAGVDKRRRSRTLIGVTDGARAAKYPSWQFTTTGTLAGLEDVLRRMRVSDPWMQMQFFLLPDVDLGESPLHALREKRMNEVIAAAERYGAEGPDA
ncbi:hypothetical protein NLM16_16675 [Bradyrhizobium brasilense]|uniref:hypothetical protein n=1 Tax=Bradyrhizobium brasilense TaxID=1419277 RepID=UPI0028773F22|nr:hypothetical protein [Bradyrhizobium brasilense]MCP3415735.1 hypothetical protein [Bradyrhizobium brasilense]